MGTKLLFVIPMIILFQNCFSQGVWIDKTSLPNGQGRQDDLSFSIGTSGYMGLGYNNDLWCYNSLSDTWLLKDPFPGIFRSGSFGFCLEDKIFFGGGNGLNDFWSYDSNLNTWDQLSDLPINVTNGIGFSIENKGYLISENKVWEYDPIISTWIEKNNFPGTIRNQATAITINNKGYLAFGKDETYGGLPDLWEFDSSADSWLRRSDCPVPRFSAYGFSVNNKGYFGGGYREWYGSDLQDFYEYDPSTDIWSMKDSPGGSYGAAAFNTNNGTGYYGFGNMTCHIGPCNPFNFFKAFTPELSTSISKVENILFDVLIFPNPTENIITISFNSSVKSDLHISIINQFGQKIYTESKFDLSGKYVNTIDLSKQSNGIYFLQIKFNNDRRTQKIVLN